MHDPLIVRYNADCGPGDYFMATGLPGVLSVAGKSSRGGKRPGSGRPKTSTRDDASTKLDRTLLTMASFVARARKTTLAAYLSDSLKPIVEKDFREESQAIGRDS